MATLPKATTTVSDTASAVAGGTDVICIMSPTPSNADMVPRMFGSASALYADHGYSEGVEYAALHVPSTRKAFMFVGLPIATPGVIGRENKSGNTGTSVTTVTAGGSGVLAEHDGEWTVITGGTIGTSQIMLGLSMDGGRTIKRVRLGTASSYTIPYFGVTTTFAAGTLVAGDTIHTWHGTAPRSDSTGWATARANLAAQSKAFRDIILIGDLQNDTEGSAFLQQVNFYETQNERFIYSRVSVLDRLPQASLSRVRVLMTGNPSLTFAEVGATGDTITRSAGSWISDGFVVGDTITVTGSLSNNVTGTIASLSATVITLGTLDLAAEGPSAGITVASTPTLTFAEVGATGDTLTRSRGSWLDDGFRVGDLVTIAGTASNNFTASAGIATITALVITFGTTDLAVEVIGAYSVTMTAGQSKAQWMAAIDAEFAPIDAAFRIDHSAGRGRVTSPFSQWYMRRPAGWAASIREFQHDLHIATWRKDDGPVGFDLYDEDGQLVEYDDRVDGAAGSAARFTTLRTWANGPQGAFVSQSLTRASEGSLLSQTHNVAVVNAACTITQLATENVIGRSLVLNDDGTATTDSLNTIQSEVNAALELGLLQNRGEGPRASKAVYTPSADDILNVPEALLTGILDLNLNGTIHSVTTSVRVRSGGQ